MTKSMPWFVKWGAFLWVGALPMLAVSGCEKDPVRRGPAAGGSSDGAGLGGADTRADGADAGLGGVGAEAGRSGAAAGGTEAGGAGSGRGGADAGEGGGIGGTDPVSMKCQGMPSHDPVVGPSAELDPDVVARAAMVIGSCMLDDGVSRNAAHVWEANLFERLDYHRLAAQVDCLANANCGCDGVMLCLGYRIDTTVDPECRTGCEGNVLRACGGLADLPEGWSVTVDCSRYGLTCDPKTINCIDSAPVACAGPAGDTCRPGQRPLFCSRATGGELKEGPDCEALGLGCEAGRCQGTGAACDTVHSEKDRVVLEGISCTGGVLEACVGGMTASIDCATQGPGFTCQSANGKPFCGLASECVPPALNLSETALASACDGTKIVFCNAGRIESVDCLDLGFTGCTQLPSPIRTVCTPGLDVLIAQAPSKTEPEPEPAPQPSPF